jgi:hypothetical protein
LAFGANTDFAGASVAVAFLVAGAVAFFVVVADAVLFAGAAFFAVPAAAFFGAGAAFFVGAAFLAGAAGRFAAGVDVLRPDEPAGDAFFAGDADFFVVVAAFFTDTFFWVERLCPATGLGEDLFPVGDFLAAAGRDPGALLAGVPLLAGVIVSSLTT